MPRPYYILLTRDSALAQWAMEFGDYSRAVLTQERLDWLDSAGFQIDAKPSWAEVVALPGDTEADIIRALAQANFPLAR